MRTRFGVVVAALWWGSLTGLGFLVVPLLFATLSTPSAAGAAAARLFTGQTWLSIGCTMVLLANFNTKSSTTQAAGLHLAIKSIVAGLLLAVLVEFGVSPRIVTARASGGDLRLWHGLGSVMYFTQWVCAGLTLWWLSALPGAQPLPSDTPSP